MRGDMSEARDYFDVAAADYRKRSERFPWSWIRGREARAVDEALGPVAGLSVLDLGCGAGLYAGRVLAQGARRVVAVDLVEAMVRSLPSGVEEIGRAHV
jgi:2-polyprenyl-3-methyl-5-hydroxy-6-metoxy-1,4-benzoquinol methylase